MRHLPNDDAAGQSRTDQSQGHRRNVAISCAQATSQKLHKQSASFRLQERRLMLLSLPNWTTPASLGSRMQPNESAVHQSSTELVVSCKGTGGGYRNDGEDGAQKPDAKCELFIFLLILTCPCIRAFMHCSSALDNVYVGLSRGRRQWSMVLHQSKSTRLGRDKKKPKLSGMKERNMATGLKQFRKECKYQQLKQLVTTETDSLF
ncbi:unnamed protein product [Protopolystoma xenopodis]|uniref:Uncharacterized protein n=1 Tax=Protopolystoma xenopodis TaxID=117903 RepID=A0A3S5B2G6_9PLAT|nr:unnamed protein product [Protopolystoma xenopodis]